MLCFHSVVFGETWKIKDDVALPRASWVKVMISFTAMPKSSLSFCVLGTVCQGPVLQVLFQSFLLAPERGTRAFGVHLSYLPGEVIVFLHVVSVDGFLWVLKSRT